MSAASRAGGGGSGNSAAACGVGRRELLRWAAALGAVTAEALAIERSITPASARSRLAAAERAGAMRAWRPLRDEPTLYTLTRSGLRASGASGLGEARVSPSGARHAVACCRAAASLAQAFPGCTVLGEPAVRRAERERRRPFAVLDARDARLALGIGARVGRGSEVGQRSGEHAMLAGHRPDMLIVSTTGGVLPVAVEVELTVKAPDRLAAICRAWARSREVSGVVYLAAGDVLGPLARAIETARAHQQVLAIALGTISRDVAATDVSAEDVSAQGVSARGVSARARFG
jgi:hypothetical protein